MMMTVKQLLFWICAIAGAIILLKVLRIAVAWLVAALLAMLVGFCTIFVAAATNTDKGVWTIHEGGDTHEAA